MIQHRNIWIYHIPTPRQLTVRGPGNEASPPHTRARERRTANQRISLPCVHRGFAYISYATRKYADGTRHSTYLPAR